MTAAKATVTNKRLSVKEAATMCGVGANCIRVLINEGIFPELGFSTETPTGRKRYFIYESGVEAFKNRGLHQLKELLEDAK